jgi:hypothetical protein
MAAADPQRKGVILFAGYPVRDLDVLAGLDNPNVVGLEAVYEWKDLEPAEGFFQWDVLDRELALWHSRGKFLDIRIMTANSNTNVTPEWVFRRYGVRRIADASFSDFEGGLDHWLLGAEAQLAGKALELKSNGQIRYAGPALDRGAVYTVQFQGTGAENLLVEATSASGGTSATRKVRFPGGLPIHAIELPLGPHADYHIAITSPGGNARLDNILVHKTSGISSDETALREQWNLGSAAAITATSDPLYGAIHSASSSPNEQVIARINADLHPRPEGARIWVEYHFRVKESGTFCVRHANNNRFTGAGHQWVGKKGDEGYRGMWVSDPAGTTLEFTHVGPGAIEISEIRTSYKGDRVTEFPDFFQPEFRAALQRFTKALADRYADHPALHAVSVMGNGRWEELMLDPDQPGLLDAQWVAAGYSPDRHIKMVESSVGDILRTFPKNKTQLQTAYGLMQVIDEGIAYRRMGGMAANRGVMLKQNGMTERYDTWHKPGDPSWLFSRYRHDPRVDLVHESGGQIYNNFLNLTGHPISYTNRALSNGCDYFYLYESDINSRSVARYFDYLATMSGSGLFTNHYAVARRQTLRQDIISSKHEFMNYWCGLRLEWEPPAPAGLWQERDGEQVMVPVNAERSLIFDLDDRARYDGLYGASLWIRTHLEPGSEVALEWYNEFARDWFAIGTLRGQADSPWQTAEFPLGDQLSIPRNGGIDPYHDIRVRALAGPSPAVQAIAINAVHARGWARRAVVAPVLSAKARRLDNVLTRRIEVPASSYPTGLSIPLRGSHANQREQVFAVVSEVAPDGTSTPLAQRLYEYVNDGDWLDVEFPRASTATQLEVVLNYHRGPVGWYETTDGELAVRLTSRVPQIATAVAADSPESITISLPTEALLLQGDGSSARIERALSGEQWSAIPHCLVTTDSGALLLFEPQQPGTLRISGIAPTTKVAYLPMQRREPLPASLERAADRQVLTIAEQITSSNSTEWTLSKPISAAPDQHLEFHLHNRSASGLARVWWAAPGANYAPAQSCWIPIVPHDDRLRLHSDAIGLEAQWTGTIERLRIDLFAATPQHGDPILQDVCLTEPIRHARVDFSEEKHRLTVVANVADQVLTADGQRITTIAGPASLLLPRSGVTVDATADQVIVLTANAEAPAQVQLRWTSADGKHRIYHPIDFPAGTSEQRVATSTLPDWSGILTQLVIEISPLPSGKGLTLKELRVDRGTEDR